MTFFGILSAFFSSFTWAFGTTTYSSLAKEYDPVHVNFMRAVTALSFFLIALVVFLVLGKSSELGLELLTPERVIFLVSSIFASYVLGDGLFLLATQSIGVPAALAIASSYPILTALFAWLVQGEGLSLIRFIGLITAISGVMIVVLGGRKKNESLQHTSKHRSVLQGVIFSGIACVCWGWNSFSIGEGGKGISLITVNLIRMSSAILFCGAISLFKKHSHIGIPWKKFYPVSFIFILEACLGSVFYVYGLSHTTFAVGATLSSLAPVVAVLIALTTKSEKLSVLKTSGIALVTVGIALLLGVFDSK